MTGSTNGTGDPSALGTPYPVLRTPASFAYCRRAVARSGSNFALAFRLLPPAQRRGMDALYAFMRATDDLSDEPGDDKGPKLAAWRTGLSAALRGEYSHPLHPALHHTVRTFGVDPAHLFAVIDGVEADLKPVRFASFAELQPYCYRVASAVGLACVPIWGCHDPRAATFAESAGIAFQLTNILRDLGEDAARGRVYLPADEIERFGCPPAEWPKQGERFRELMRFQAARAWEFYAKGDELTPLLPPPGRAVFRVMAGTYQALLGEIERRGFDVFTARVRVPRWRKALVLAGAVPARLGLG